MKEFELLPKDERARLVRKIMEAGGSNRSAARELGTTIGAIARTRWEYRIPSLNRFVPRMRSAQAPLKIAASEATQCTFTERALRCAYEREPLSDRCRLHKRRGTKR